MEGDLGVEHTQFIELLEVYESLYVDFEGREDEVAEESVGGGCFFEDYLEGGDEIG